jgi:hypothetical protein
LNLPRSAFDSEFEKVYAKMLEIGTANDQLQVFQDLDGKGSECPLNFPPAVPLPNVQEPKATTSTVPVMLQTSAPSSTPTDCPPNGEVQVITAPVVQQRAVEPTPSNLQVVEPKESNPATTSRPKPSVFASSAQSQSTLLIGFFSLILILLGCTELLWILFLL